MTFMQILLTGIVAMMPLLTILAFAAIFIGKTNFSRLILLIVALVVLMLTIVLAVWYFHQPFQGEGMGVWYVVVIVLLASSAGVFS